ncbi:MAG: Sec-independent protein translocase protein TatB [Sphingopyxis sp.]
MFDVAPTEMLVVAIVALLVIGPKDLPKAMRFVGKWVGKARGMARHFRSGIDTMMREAELDDLEKQWRNHNESIMRAYPDVAGGAAGPVLPPPSDAANALLPAPFPDGFSGADLMGPPQPASMPQPEVAPQPVPDVAATPPPEPTPAP